MKGSIIRFLITIALSVFIVNTATIFAAQKKGYNANISIPQDTLLDKTCDWVATIGRSEKEKMLIISQRKSRRQTLRIQDEADKRAQEMQRKRERNAKINEKKLKERSKKYW